MSEAAIRAAADAGQWNEATTVALHTYGDEILGYLATTSRDAAVAQDVFSMTLERIWAGLPRFQWRCSFRTWAYRLARNELIRYRQSPAVRRATPLDSSIEEIAAEIRSRTATFLRTEIRDTVAALRAALDPDDQALLTLRVNRGLPWRDIAVILAEAGTGDDDAMRGMPTDAELDLRAAALRKRFMRLKDSLRDQIRARRGARE